MVILIEERKIVNDLLHVKQKNTHIDELRIDGRVASDSTEIWNEINIFFSSVVQDLGRTLPLSDVLPLQF